MERWGEFEFNGPYEGDDIAEISGVKLPEGYLEFMRAHNGGRGDIGASYLVLYPLNMLGDLNDELETGQFLPGRIIIGSNGGGEFYGIDNKGNYFNVPMIMEEKDIALLGDDIELLPDRIKKLWD